MSKTTASRPNGILDWNPNYSGDSPDSTSVLAHELFHAWATVWKKREGKLEPGEKRWEHAFGGDWDTSSLSNLPFSENRPSGPWETNYNEALSFRIENQILAERGMAAREPAGNFRLMNKDPRFKRVQYEVPAADLEAVQEYLK